MKIIFVLIFIIASFNLNAQTGIGTTTPHASAKLEVASDRQGFLPPQVSLTGPNDITTIKNRAGASITPATGLLVYCKGDAGLAAGYYYWNGTAWATIATAGGSGSFASSFMRGSRIASQTIAVGSDVIFTNINNVAGNDIALNTSTGKITLAAGNTYRLRAAVPNFSGGQRPAFIWFNETAGVAIGSGSFIYNPADNASLPASGSMAEVIITPSVSTVVTFRLTSSLSNTSVTVGGNADFSTTGSYPWFDIQVISGNAPVTGQTVDYVQASLSTNQTLSTAGNIVFNVSSGAGITLNNGGFNLIANKTYKLEAALGGTSGAFAYYAWVDNTNAMLPGGSVGSIMKAGSSFVDAPQDKAVVYYTPTTNTTVYLRVISVSSGVTAYAPNISSNYSSTWANITQIGSSAIVNPWVLSGNNVYNNTGNVGIGTTTPSSKLDVTGDVNIAGVLNVTGSSVVNLQTPILNIGYGSGDEGGELRLALPQTNNSLSTGVGIDVYRNQLRFFENGGSARGVNIDLSKAPSGTAGELLWKASGIVNAGTFVSLDNLKVTVTTSGARGLSIGAVSSSFTANITAWYSMVGGVAGTAAANAVYTTAAATSAFGWGFPSEGDGSYYHIYDKTNNRVYRVTLMIGGSYLNNFISIERLF
jgi:hypothetical protein